MNVNDPNLSALTTPSTPFAEWLIAGQSWVEAELDRRLPPANTRPVVIHEAMRYAVLGGGKRLRAILAHATCQALGGDWSRVTGPALAVEIYHASTLIHDDLPCMDDDDLRRGKPATHIAYGEANALLAGDALIFLASEWAAQTFAPLPHMPSTFVLELARAGGSQGVIGGQIEDLAAEELEPDEATVRFIHTEKTARLISCATRVGAIAAGACESKTDKLGQFGIHLGLAFQTLDDILDTTSTTEELGKPVGSDEGQGKATMVALHGLDRAKQIAEEHTEDALRILEECSLADSRLHEIARWLLKRSF